MPPPADRKFLIPYGQTLIPGSVASVGRDVLDQAARRPHRADPIGDPGDPLRFLPEAALGLRIVKALIMGCPARTPTAADPAARARMAEIAARGLRNL